MKLSITTDGEIMAIYSDDLVGLIDLGRAEITRASDVEPTSLGGWRVSMRDDTSAAAFALQSRTFKRRADALAAEVAYLENRLFLGHSVDCGYSGVSGYGEGPESRSPLLPVAKI
jgi:hypothetical protein